MSTLKKFWEKNKKGMFVGGLVGLGIAWYLGSVGANLDFALQSAGAIDTIKSTLTTSANLAQTKVGMAYILLGSLTGGLISDMSKK